MRKEKEVGGVAPGSPEGARSATEGEPGAAADVKRWSAARKKEVVLRLLRGEPVDAVSREVAVPIYKLEQWRDRALAGMDAGLKERENDPVARQLDDAKRRIGKLVMGRDPAQGEADKAPFGRPEVVAMSRAISAGLASLTAWSGSVGYSTFPLDDLRTAGAQIERGGAIASDAAPTETDGAGWRRLSCILAPQRIER